MGFQAKQADLLTPTTAAQATDQYGNVVKTQQQQQDFLAATQAQGGLGNQSSVFNQMQGVASGTGPNPAQAMLANATGANVANQAALMAGQRGSGANAGMMARQAAMQGANTQQQAAGQGAALQAQQSLGALGQMGNIAGQQVAQQQGALTGAAQGAQQGYGQVSQNIGAQNQANIANVSQANQANAAMAKEVAGQQGNLLGNIMGAAGTVAGGMMGGPVGASLGGMAGNAVSGMFSPKASAPAQGSSSADYKSLPDVQGSSSNDYKNLMAKGGNVGGPQSRFGQHLANGGKVAAMVSPGEQYLTPMQASKVVQGKAPAMTAGKTIPGKPVVGGAKNDYANDTVPATLEAGGVVIPRSITQGKDAEAKAQAFVKAHFAQRNGRK